VRARGVLFCVDAIQSVGALPIDVRKSKIAFLAADGHKWMCGPETVTIFYAAAEHRDKLEVLESGWTNVRRGGRFIECDYELLPDARRSRRGRSTPTASTACARDRSAAGDRDQKHRPGVIAIATKLANRLDAIGWRVASPRRSHPGSSAPFHQP